MVTLDAPELVRRAVAQDGGAWEALVEQYKRLVWGILRKVRSLGAAAQEDLYQEVFLTLVRGGLVGFHGQTEWELRVYLRTITVNKVRDHLRAQSRRHEVSGEDGEGSEQDGLWAPPVGRSPEDNVASRQILEQAVRCLQELTEVDRQIFLKRAAGYPYDEIAAVLELPQGTVASKHHRAKARVEQCMRRAGVLEENPVAAAEDGLETSAPLDSPKHGRKR